jgi:hypothetical protein
LYQQVFQKISLVAEGTHLRVSSLKRLALLTTGILAAKSTVSAQIAQELLALGLTDASCQESIQRRLRRTLNDASLTPGTCYQSVLHQVIPRQTLLQGRNHLFLIVDASSKEEQIHLFRVSLPYWGDSLPIAWAVWGQNQPKEARHYWAMVDILLAQVAALLPQGLEVVVLADRAYDNPPFIRSAQGLWLALRPGLQSQGEPVVPGPLRLGRTAGTTAGPTVAWPRAALESSRLGVQKGWVAPGQCSGGMGCWRERADGGVD